MVIANTTIDNTSNAAAVHIINMDIDDENCFVFCATRENATK